MHVYSSVTESLSLSELLFETGGFSFLRRSGFSGLCSILLAFNKVGVLLATVLPDCFLLS